MIKAGVFLAEGFEEIEAITIVDVLRRADMDVITISTSSQKVVSGAHHIPIIADKLFNETDFDGLDMILLPGGMPGSRNLDAHEGLKNQIKNFHQNKKWLGAICAAPMVFGRLGILNGEKAVCYPGYETELKGATIVKTEPFVVSNRIITGNGIGGALPFILKIVELLDSPKKAEKLAKAMLVTI